MDYSFRKLLKKVIYARRQFYRIYLQSTLVLILILYTAPVAPIVCYAYEAIPGYALIIYDYPHSVHRTPLQLATVYQFPIPAALTIVYFDGTPPIPLQSIYLSILEQITE